MAGLVASWVQTAMPCPGSDLPPTSIPWQALGSNRGGRPPDRHAGAVDEQVGIDRAELAAGTEIANPPVIGRPDDEMIGPT